MIDRYRDSRTRRRDGPKVTSALKKKENKTVSDLLPMLCGELLNGGFVSAGAVPAVPCGLLGLWLPGCLRATSPRLLTSPYLTLLAELLAAGYLEQHQLRQGCEPEQHRNETNLDLTDIAMDLARRNQHTNGQSEDLDLDLDNDESAFLGESLYLFSYWHILYTELQICGGDSDGIEKL